MKNKVLINLPGLRTVAAGAVVLFAGRALLGADVQSPLPSGAVTLRGGLDREIRLVQEGWILGDVPCHKFAEFFRTGRPKFAMGEMWGKFVRSGCMFYRYTRDPRVAARMTELVEEILATERENGSISCTPVGEQPGDKGGDLWERKYVLLGLEGYYDDVKADPRVLASMRRQADAILAQVGPPPKRDVRDLGWSPNHVESSTLLEPMMRLYRLTGDARYLAFAKYLVDCGGAKGSNLIDMAVAKVPPHLMGGVYPKAYETTSYFEGLADYVRASGDERVRAAVLGYFALVRDRELTIVGNGGADQPFHPRVCGEAWSDTAREQTNPDITRMMETCTGVTWMKYCSHVLRMTGDCSAAEAIERYVFNGLLGAMKPDGRGFSYVNLLNGKKVTNAGWGWNFDGKPVTCCNLNGPMGLAYIPYVAVMQAEDGPVVNLYNGLVATAKTPVGRDVRLEMTTDYPYDAKVRLVVTPSEAERFAVRLRLPSCSAKTQVAVNGKAVESTAKPGAYLTLTREWTPGDVVEMAFALKGLLVESPKGVNRAGDGRVAVQYGPIVLARDERVDPKYDQPVAIRAETDGTVALRRIVPAPGDARIAFAVGTADGEIVMTDYASVDCWNGSRVCTWMKRGPSVRPADVTIDGVCRNGRRLESVGDLSVVTNDFGAFSFSGLAPQGRSQAAGGYPLVVFRLTSSPLAKPDFFRACCAVLGKYRGAFDEFWYGGGKPLCKIDRCRADLRKFAEMRPQIEAAGMGISFQQGLTLGHDYLYVGKPGAYAAAGVYAPDEVEPFPDDAWMVRPNGEVAKGKSLCPRSPAVLAYERRFAAAVLEELRPATYWLDDDLRLGVGKVGCFCARCLAAFGEQVGRPISREELERRLFRGDELDAIRLEWIKFNEQSLAAYGRVVREAANATMPGCRLALQTVSADALLNGRDYGPVLEALSDGGKVPSGVRPGHGCYTEERPMAFLEKALWVTREAERCRRLGAVCGTVCYEEETYPRKVLHKSPNAIVNECALALASGCDTLSLYWADGEAPEYVEDCERFVKAVAGARRYFERLSASTRRTSLGGVARYLGARACEQRGFSLGDGTDLALARCGIPVTVAEATASGKAWFVTERSKKAMTSADWKALEKTGFLEVVPTPYPKVSTRRRWLDRLDRLTDGKFPVRIDRAHALRVLPRMRSDGKVDSVTLFNLSMGDADELKVRVRNPGGAAPVWMESGGREAQPVSAAAGALPGEVVLRIPNLRGWQVGTVFF